MPIAQLGITSLIENAVFVDAGKLGVKHIKMHFIRR